MRTDGRVICWGAKRAGETEAPSGRYSQVSAGWDHSCGLRSDGGVVCWGRNTHGRTEAPAGRYSQVSGLGPQLRAAFGRRRGLLGLERVRPEGGAVGPLQPGQRGLFSQLRAAFGRRRGLLGRERIRPGGGADDSQVSAGFAGCVRTAGCWGRNRDGQTEAPSGRYSQVSAGEDHSCGLRSDGGVVCWGANLFANLHAAGDRMRGNRGTSATR